MSFSQNSDLKMINIFQYTNMKIVNNFFNQQLDNIYKLLIVCIFHRKKMTNTIGLLKYNKVAEMFYFILFTKYKINSRKLWWILWHRTQIWHFINIFIDAHFFCMHVSKLTQKRLKLTHGLKFFITVPCVWEQNSIGNLA